MVAVFPDFLRAIVSGIMNVLLMLLLIQPKYNKKITFIIGTFIILIDFSVACFCYLFNNLNVLTSLDLILLTVLCFIVKPFFKDTFMQWLYSYITVENANMIVVVLSYYISRLFPFPLYTNTVVRFILFAVLIILFHSVIRPLYRQAVNHWNIYFYVALCIFAFFTYYIVILGDVITVLNEQKIPLLLLCLLSVATYGSMFHSLKQISKEYKLKSENIKMKADQNLLQIASQSLNERMKLMDSNIRELSIQKHDQRHFNATILELIENDNKDKAIEYLKSSLHYTIQKSKSYCENSALNAVICYYISLAEQNGITCKVKLNIPEDITVDPFELSMVIANLLENAINATIKAKKRQINMTAVFTTGQLIIEIANPYSGEILFDESGYPVSSKKNHGVGTQSVIAFCEKNDAEILYSACDNSFKVRLIL